jgi:glutamate racemase
MTGPIGIFDSGFGGLTVVSQFIAQLPAESIIYFGDNARVPYGSRTKEEIQDFTLEATRFLVAKGIKALVIACNTATAAALPVLKSTFSLPVIGIIEPGAKKAVQTSFTREIGVVGTEYTIKSDSYREAILKLNPFIRVYQQVCPLFVPFVEKGNLLGPEVEAVAREYLSFMAGTRVDTLILGCTHYPHLIHTIRRVVGPDLHLIDPAEAVVAAAKDILKEKGLLAPLGNNPEHRFYTSTNPEYFLRIGQQLLGLPMVSVEQVAVKKALID